MRKKLSILGGMLLLCFQMAIAQNVDVSGKITDDKGNPIPNASIIERGTNNGTTSDQNGKFNLTVKKNASLEISSIGFDKKTVSAGAGGAINAVIELSASNQNLTEVVVTALGIKREKKALGYAVSTIGKKDLELRPEGDIGRLLSGKAPGVNILATSGLSGSGTNIQIRGVNSINGGTNPLFVVDGVPFNSSTNSQAGAIYGHQTSSRFLDLDPNNIESVSVLKGLSATILYGDLGRNGVILITTKNSSAAPRNKKNEVTVSQSFFINEVSALPEYQNTYGGGFSSAGGFSFFSNWGPKFSDPSQTLLHPYAAGAIAASFPELAGKQIEFKAQNNIKPFFRQGFVQNTSVNISSAINTNTTLNASYSYMDDQGFLENNRVYRNTFGVGINSKLTNKLNISSTINYVLNDFKSPTTGLSTGSGAQSGGGSIFADLFYTPRANDLFGWPYQTPDGASAYYRPNNDIQNPRWALYNSLIGQKTNRSFGNVSLKYDLLKSLSVTYRLGFDNYNEAHALNLNKGGKSAAAQTEYEKGIYRTVDGNNSIWNHSLFAQYNVDFNEDWKFDIIGGANSNNESYAQTGVKSTEQLVFGLFDHSNFVNHDTKGEDGSDLDYKYKETTLGLYAQAGLSFKDFLYVNVGGRNSWSSTLEKENRSKFYPSGSVSFIPTSAIEGLKSNKILNYLKLRVGYATAARFPSAYTTRPSLGISTNDFVDRTSIIVNTNAISNRLPNPDLKAELMGEIEAGIEGKLIDNRVSFDFTVYQRKSTNQILDNPLDPSSGYTVQAINAGDLTNKGIELGLGITIIRSKDWTWQIDGNFAMNRSKVSNLPEGISQIQTGGQYSNLGNYAINGQPLGIIKGNYWVKQNDGGKTGERVVGPDGYYIESSDIEIIGDPNPDYKLTGISNLSYKSFQFRMQWDYTHGGDMYSVLTNSMIARGLAKVTDVDRAIGIILPGVKQDGSKNDFMVPLDRSYFNTYFGASEQYMYDASVIRLREVSLSYYLPTKVLDKTPIGSASITLSGQNLWFNAPNFPKGTNLDPEISGGGVGRTRGFEYITGPTSRRMGVSLKVSF